MIQWHHLLAGVHLRSLILCHYGNTTHLASRLRYLFWKPKIIAGLQTTASNWQMLVNVTALSRGHCQHCSRCVSAHSLWAVLLVYDNVLVLADVGGKARKAPELIHTQKIILCLFSFPTSAELLISMDLNRADLDWTSLQGTDDHCVSILCKSL